MHIIVPKLKNQYDQFMNPLSKFFHLKLGLSPNQVSCIGYIIGLISVIVIIVELWQIGLVLMIISLIFDGIDGNIARIYNLESKSGEMLELIFDRSLEILIFLAISLVMKVPILLYFLVVYSILMVTILRDKTRFDPGFKRIALVLGFFLNFEIIFQMVFLIHLFSFMLQMVLLDFYDTGSGIIC